MSAPYRIFSLIESCPLSQHEGAATQHGEMGSATRYVAGWLNANPGRWFLVGEILDRQKNSIGIGRVEGLRKFGFDAEVANNKVYARTPHASGVPLGELVARKPPGRTDAMPELQRDSFNWSLAELRTAASTAREWLLGEVGHAAAA